MEATPRWSGAITIRDYRCGAARRHDAEARETPRRGARPQCPAFRRAPACCPRCACSTLRRRRQRRAPLERAALDVRSQRGSKARREAAHDDLCVEIVVTRARSRVRVNEGREGNRGVDANAVAARAARVAGARVPSPSPQRRCERSPREGAGSPPLVKGR